MKLLFVINDADRKYMDYIHTGVLNASNRRAVEIELTPEQIKQIGIKKLGYDRGMDIMETIESISLNAL